MTLPDDIFRNQVEPKKKWRVGEGDELKHIYVYSKMWGLEPISSLRCINAKMSMTDMNV